MKKNPQKDPPSETPMVAVLEKTAVDAKSKHHKKDTKPASASLEAHQATFSLGDVSILLALDSEYTVLSLLSFPFPSASDAEVLSLGTEFLEFWKAANENKGRCSHTLFTKCIYCPHYSCISMDLST
jgi:hypothetical protein